MSVIKTIDQTVDALIALLEDDLRSDKGDKHDQTVRRVCGRNVHRRVIPESSNRDDRTNDKGNA